MVLRIRFSRFGCKNKPFYRVMAADSRSPRDGKHLEVLGYFNPPQDGGKRMGLNFDRVNLQRPLMGKKFNGQVSKDCLQAAYWLSVGAQPSDPVQRILFRARVLPPPPMLATARKGGPRDTRLIDPMTGRYLTPKSTETGEQPKDDEGKEGEGAES